MYSILYLFKKTSGCWRAEAPVDALTPVTALWSPGAHRDQVDRITGFLPSLLSKLSAPSSLLLDPRGRILAPLCLFIFSPASDTVYQGSVLTAV